MRQKEAPTIVYKTPVASCTGEGAACRSVVNAIGDAVTIDVSKYPVTALGTISQDKSIDIDLPQIPGSQKVYSVKFTSGESAGKIIYIVFDNIPTKAGTRLAGKTQIKIYRRFEDQKPNAWTEIGTIEPNGIVREKDTVVFKADGTAVWTDRVNNKPVVFLLGKKDLK